MHETPVEPRRPVSLAQVNAARQRIADVVIHTPLVRLNVDDAPAEIYLKLENLHPVGAFKLRGAANAIAAGGPEQLEPGVWTASTGNMAQSVAWYARHLGLDCTVVIPDSTPGTKQAGVRRLNARIVKLPYIDYVEIFRTWKYEPMEGLFVHPFGDPAVMAGNGTIALEILEDLPDVDAIVVPYGGGGLSCGMASVVRELKPDTKIYACEPQTAAPLAAAVAAGEPVDIDRTPSFVDAIGGPCVFPEMWPLSRDLLDGPLVIPLEEIAAAIRTIAQCNRVIAEGAAATPVAAALAGKAGGGKVVCVVSGGNIDPEKLATILQGKMP